MTKREVSLEFIATQQERIIDEMAAIRAEMRDGREESQARFAILQKSDDRMRVRFALMDTKQKDMAADYAAIARVVERARLLDDK